MIEYLRDVDLPGQEEEPEGGWPSEAFLDPMHPCHGPVAKLQGLLEAEGERFLVSLWDTGDAILTFLELCKEDPTGEDEPLLPMEDAHRFRGWIAQTYNWREDEDAMVCMGHRVYFPEYPGLKEEVLWMKDVYRQVMIGSVTLATSIAPALPLQMTRRLRRLGERPGRTP